MTNTAILTVGSRIFCNLYGRGAGTIYAIHGEQSPDTCKMFGGIMAAGGSAKFDAVFDQGDISNMIEESVLRSSGQWRILEEPADSPEAIAQKLAAAATKKALAEARETESKNLFAAEVARLKTAPEYSHLKQVGENLYSSKAAVANIRTELKKHFPATKFSVRSDHSAVNIGWTDGPTESAVEKITNSYKAGSFNGMEDIYEYNRKPFTEVFGDINYIFTNRSYSDAMVQKALDATCELYGYSESVLNLTTYRAGGFWKIDHCLDRLIREQLAKM